MTLSARLAREGMLRTVIPLKLYRNSILFAGAASARFVRWLTRDQNRLIPGAHLDLRGNRLGLGEAAPGQRHLGWTEPD